ncbi:MAG: type II secretion system F family protein [Pseudonocardia sp.]
MVIAAACACLAVALATLPGPAGTGRLQALQPRRAATRRRLPLPAAAAVVAGAAAGFATAGPGGGVAGALVAATVRRRRAARTAAGAADATATQVAEALRRITDELRTGAHPATALAGVDADGPLAAAALAGAAAAAQMGDDVPRALRRGAAGQPAVAADLDRIAASWSLAERHGVPLADLLAGAHGDITWRVQYGRRVRAQLAGPRATAVVLTALPGLGLLLGQLLGADPLGVLRAGIIGQTLLVLGVGLTAAGFAWTDRILRVAVPR